MRSRGESTLCQADTHGADQRGLLDAAEVDQPRLPIRFEKRALLLELLLAKADPIGTRLLRSVGHCDGPHDLALSAAPACRARKGCRFRVQGATLEQRRRRCFLERASLPPLVESFARRSLLDAPRFFRKGKHVKASTASEHWGEGQKQALREDQSRLASQKKAFQLAVSGAPIGLVLNSIVQAAQAHTGGDSRSAIFMADSEGARLRFKASSGMAEAYTDAADGFVIGPQSPSCGNVAFTGSSIIVPDVDADPLWVPFLPLAHEHGVRACWSFPMLASTGKVLGTLAIYHRAPREPEPSESRYVEELAQTAALIIETTIQNESRLWAEQQLRLNHDSFFGLIENAPFGIYVVDAQFRLRQINAGSRKVFEGVHPLIGRDFAEVLRAVWAEPFATEAIERFRHTLESGAPYSVSNTRETRHGVARTESFDWKIERITLADGTFGVVCYFYDFSERMRAEADALLHRELLETVVRNIPVGAALIRASDMRYQLANAAYEAIAGTEEIVGKTVQEAWSEAPVGFVANCEKVAESGEAYESVDEMFRTGVGAAEQRYFSWSKHRVQLPEQEGWGILVSATETTRRTHTEAQLREADKRKSEFLATLAHELRNPLAPIANAVHLLRLEGIDTAKQRAAADIIDRQLRQMVRLVDDLLDISRISQAKIRLVREQFDISSAVNQAVETIRPLCMAMEHQLTITHARSPIFVDADATRLAQVVSNLLNNACKFTERGGSINLKVEREGSQAVIRVQDNGIGIAPEQLPRIFDMFAQADTSLERTQGGLGIGLALAKNLIELHGGSLEARSNGLGQGSEFIARIAALEMSPKSAQSGDAGCRPSACVSRRVLVVDDNRDAAESVAELLRLAGHEVVIAFDGTAAVSSSARFRPELVLLDIGLPGMNGFEVARYIREDQNNQGATLVALTGWGQAEDRDRSEAAGFDAHLVKPLELGALTDLLRELPGRQRIF